MTRVANWKSPVPDRLPNFWIKQFKSLHKPMAEAYLEIIKDPKQTPDWLVEGDTNLLPKKKRNMDHKELQANSMTANHLQDPDISHCS